ANASCVRHWHWPQPAEEKVGATNLWFQLVTQLEKIKWRAPAELTGRIQGDARDFNSFTADVRLSAPALESPWASANHLLCSLLWRSEERRVGKECRFRGSREQCRKRKDGGDGSCM